MTESRIRPSVAWHWLDGDGVIRVSETHDTSDLSALAAGLCQDAGIGVELGPRWTWDAGAVRDGRTDARGVHAVFPNRCATLDPPLE